MWRCADRQDALKKMLEIGIPPEALPVWVGGSHPGTPMFDILLKQISDGCLAAAVT